MQDFCKKDSDLSSAHSTAPSVAGCTSWWTSGGSQIQQSSLSTNKSLKMATPNQCGRNGKQIGFQFRDQDSSSTQSTGQSYHEVASAEESDPYGQSISSLQSGYSGIHGKPGVGQNKSAVLLGTQDCVLPPSQFNCRKSFTCVPLTCTDPYYSGLLAAYGGPQATIQHLQMLGMPPARVALPLDLPQDDPIYVNPKQYRAILRRRQYRAKLEAQNKLSKARKPYLHESRHLHALKRARGSGGRFLNTKKLQESNPSSSNEQHISGPTQLHLTANASESDIHQRENFKNGASTTSCSDITSASNSENFLQQREFRFSAYPSCISRAMQSGGADVCGGSQHYVPVLR